MGKEKTTTETQSSASQQYTPTAEETKLQQLQLGQYEELQPQQTEYFGSSYDLATALLQGEQLPGYLQGMQTGIDEQTIADQSTKYALDALPSFQKLGLTESGTAARNISKGIATDIALPSQEYNTNLLLSMLNLASGQAATGTQQFSGGTNTLAQALAGQGTSTSSGTQSSTVSSMNPFLKSLQMSAGRSLGQTMTGGRSVGYGPFSIGGTN